MINNLFDEIDRNLIADSANSDLESNLKVFCNEIGTRFPGTDGYKKAAEFGLERLKSYGFENAHLEPFEFLAWRRGKSAEFRLVSPVKESFECFELPYGSATGPDGIEAGIVDIEAGSDEQIDAQSEAMKGKFVLTTSTAQHRTVIYDRCIELGAVGFVFHNTIEDNIITTGTVANEEEGKIPAIGITLESAEKIKELIKDTKAPVFRIFTDGTCESDTSWNVVAELPGSDIEDVRDELVIMGGHLDSHDIGPGAYDNCSGSVLVLETARLLAAQKEHLKRPIRFILFGAEEIGLLGSHYHAKAHAGELTNARFMLNCDMPSPVGPHGLGFHECPKGKAYLEKLSEQIGEEILCQNRAHCHSDHYPFILQGVPTAGVAGKHPENGPKIYIHSANDTAEKISIPDMNECAAFMARMMLRACNDEEWPDMRRTPEDIENFGK